MNDKIKLSLFYGFLIVVCLVMYYGTQVIPIIYGICIFLYAMKVLNSSFKLISGIETFLKIMTKSRFKAFTFGFTTCTLMQSSGLVSVLAISFLSAGLITLTAGLGIIFGANLGCLTGGWLVAAVGLKINISAYAMPMIVIGLISTYSNHKATQGMGFFLFSIGLLFLGIHYMKSGFDSIKDTIDLSQYAMTGIQGLIVYFLIGVIITIIMQSSHATITLAITALAAGQITYENSIAIVIGSNVGSTIMSIIGAFSANIEGKKLTVAHVIFNFTTAIIMLVLVNPFTSLTDILSAWGGIADDDYTLKLALFNSIFQIVGVLIFYPLTVPMARMLNKYVVAKKGRSKVDHAKYLSEESLAFSKSAINVLAREIEHLFSNTLSIIAKTISLSKADIESEEPVGAVIAKRNKPMEVDFNELYENRFKVLYSEIIEYSVDAAKNASSDDLPVLLDIRRCAMNLAESLKHAQTIQPNFFRFMTSQNEHIQLAYNKLRTKMLYTLRLINENNIESTEKDKDKESLNRDFESQINALNEIITILRNEETHLDALLRDRKITGTMATSLMNDTAQVRSMVSSLAQIVITLKGYQAKYIEKKVTDKELEEKSTEESEQKAG